MDIPKLIIVDDSFPITLYEGNSNEASWISCLEDDPNGVIVITNITNEIKKYKEFNDKCNLYIAPIRKHNLFYIPADTFYTIIGCDTTKTIRVTAPSVQYSNEIKIKTMNIQNKLDFGVYNDLVYNGKLNINYKDIIKINRLYHIQTFNDDKSNNILRELKTISNDTTKPNRFLNTIILQRVFTSSLCDWIRYEIIKLHNRTTIHIDPNEMIAITSYLEYFINNTFISEFCSCYGISLDLFSINIHGYIFHKITTENSVLKHTDATFSMDIAITDVKGYYHFNDGTSRNLNKGDCIIYANATQTHNNNIGNDTPCILKIAITIEPKKPTIKMVY